MLRFSNSVTTTTIIMWAFICLLVDILLSFLFPLVQKRFTKEQTDTNILVFCCLYMFKEWLTTAYIKQLSKSSLEKAAKFHKEALVKYNTLSQSDRESESVHVFLDAMNGMKSVIQTENSWFKVTYKTMFSMLATTGTTIYTTWSLKPVLYIIISYIGVWFFIQQHMKKMKQDRLKSKKVSKTNTQRNRLDYSKLRLGDSQVIDDIVSRETTVEETYKQREQNWQDMGNLTSMPLLFAMLICILSQPIESRLDLSFFFLGLYQNVFQITGFLGQYESIKLKRDKYNEYWKDKTFKPLPEQRSLDDNNEKFIVKEYSYLGNGPKVCFDQLISIDKGDIIRLTGSTGAGKTTFVNALKGVVPGLVLSSNIDPMSYLSKISHMRQDIRDAIPFGEVSILDLFNNCNKDLILSVFNAVGLMKWFKVQMNEDLHKQINNNISGGQKTLFCLAITLVDAMDKQMLILDEPEQGLDTELVPQTMANIFTWMKEKNPTLRIIFISHLCECVVKRLPKHDHWHLKRDEKVFALTVS